MRELFVAGCLVAVAVSAQEPAPAAPPAAALSPAEAAQGFRPLFDGTSTDGWRGFRKDAFPERGRRVEAGTLRVVAGGGGGDVVTAEQFADFELRLEWKVAGGANSGIMYRVSEQEPAPWRTGPEYQILDDAGHADGRDARTSAGSLYALVAGEPRVLRPVGEWNEARIVADGPRIEHWLNGRRILVAQLGGDAWQQLVAASKFAKMARFGREPRGAICLQDHGNDVWFRNVRIREIRRAAEPVELFDGKSLDGWVAHLPDGTPATEVFAVASDGVLVCRGTPNGYLRTARPFTDFVLELEWRWNPDTKVTGNSGVLFRMRGEDKVWPTSIEAQLQHGRAGDFWRIGDYPMQVEPERTRGLNTRHLADAEKPPGEWNHYRITADGGRILLEINGQEVNHGWDAAVHAGPICLQSEGTEIHFRNLRLR